MRQMKELKAKDREEEIKLESDEEAKVKALISSRQEKKNIIANDPRLAGC